MGARRLCEDGRLASNLVVHERAENQGQLTWMECPRKRLLEAVSLSFSNFQSFQSSILSLFLENFVTRRLIHNLQVTK